MSKKLKEEKEKEKTKLEEALEKLSLDEKIFLTQVIFKLVPKYDYNWVLFALAQTLGSSVNNISPEFYSIVFYALFNKKTLRPPPTFTTFLFIKIERATEFVNYKSHLIHQYLLGNPHPIKFDLLKKKLICVWRWDKRINEAVAFKKVLRKWLKSHHIKVFKNGHFVVKNKKPGVLNALLEIIVSPKFLRRGTIQNDFSVVKRYFLELLGVFTPQELEEEVLNTRGKKIAELLKKDEEEIEKKLKTWKDQKDLEGFSKDFFFEPGPFPCPDVMQKYITPGVKCRICGLEVEQNKFVNYKF